MRDSLLKSELFLVNPLLYGLEENYDVFSCMHLKQVVVIQNNLGKVNFVIRGKKIKKEEEKKEGGISKIIWKSCLFCCCFFLFCVFFF